jgi:hypothetical protein
MQGLSLLGITDTDCETTNMIPYLKWKIVKLADATQGAQIYDFKKDR